MEIHEFVDEGLGHSSYLVVVDGSALVIDPPRFPTEIETRARGLGVEVGWTADTHSHADYVTGSPALAARSSAVFVAPAASNLVTSYRPVTDSEVVELAGSWSLRALTTPGHTPDHMAYLLCRAGEPVGLFSGGSLMVGTVGRTDLCGPDLVVPLAHKMFHSLHRFDDLPDDLAVYPTHGAGSFCGAPGSSARTTTLGTERSTNPLLKIGDEDQFVEALLAGFGTFPSYFGRLPEVNRRGPTPYDHLPALAKLSTGEVADALTDGALVVDARPMRGFGAAHIPGSLANPLRPVFASWAGWLVDPDRPLVFVLDPDQDSDDLVRQCLDVGLEHLLGELDGGITAWVADGRPIAHLPVVDAAGITATVIDVRQANEYATGHVPDAANIELGFLPDTDLPVGSVTVMCGHGERAMTAASILASRGHSPVSVFDGGPNTWAAATGQNLETTP